MARSVTAREPLDLPANWKVYAASVGSEVWYVGLRTHNEARRNADDMATGRGLSVPRPSMRLRGHDHQSSAARAGRRSAADVLLWQDGGEEAAEHVVSRNTRTEGRRIGELAAMVGINPRTLRYYEAIGLLPSDHRTTNGYRVYGPEDEARLRFILKAKVVGLTLAEIGDILSIWCGGESPCPQVVALLDQKLATIDREITRLHAFRQELATLREEATRTRTAPAAVCGIIEHHDESREHREEQQP